MAIVDHLIESYELQPNLSKNLQDLFLAIHPNICLPLVYKVRLIALNEVEDKSAARAHMP